jgi:hypothetical protein
VIVTPAPFRKCRTFGHQMDDVPGDWTPSFGVPVTMRCMRCGTERRDSVNRSTGAVESRRYVYPPGYLLGRDDDRPTRDEFRLWFIGEQENRRKRRAS